LIAGIGWDTEVQVGNDGYINQYGGHHLSQQGLGDPTLRVKHNFWGNDGAGKSALGILPFLVVPAGSRQMGTKRAIHGIHLPYTYSLSDLFSLDIMPIWRRAPDEAGTGYHDEADMALVLGYALTDKVDFFIHYVNRFDLVHFEKWNSFYGAGVAYRVARKLQLDLEVNDGISPAEDDLQIMLGFTYLIN
jgi:hypothetical protein